MNWLKAVVVAAMKGAAKGAIYSEGDKLQEALRRRIEKEGPSAIDRTIDEAQKRTIFWVQTWGPAWAFLQPARGKIAKAIQEFGDVLQQGLKKEAVKHGASAVDKVFDKAQEELIEKIDAIKL